MLRSVTKPRKLTLQTVPAVIKSDKITMKKQLKNQRLEDRMKSIAEDCSTRMFNGVQHVWSEHIAVEVEESLPSPTMAQMSDDDLMETVA